MFFSHARRHHTQHSDREDTGLEHRRTQCSTTHCALSAAAILFPPWVACACAHAQGNNAQDAQRDTWYEQHRARMAQDAAQNTGSQNAGARTSNSQASNSQGSNDGPTRREGTETVSPTQRHWLDPRRESKGQAKTEKEVVNAGNTARSTVQRGKSPRHWYDCQHGFCANDSTVGYHPSFGNVSELYGVDPAANSGWHPHQHGRHPHQYRHYAQK